MDKMCRQTGASLPLPGSAGAVGSIAVLAGLDTSQAYYLIGPSMLHMLKSDILKNLEGGGIILFLLKICKDDIDHSCIPYT